MLITTAAFLTALGLACWILGTATTHLEIAVIGGVIILGVGAVISGGVGAGLQEKVGETEVQTDDNTTEIQNQYQEVESPEHLPLGGMIMILGGVIVLRSFNEFSKL